VADSLLTTKFYIPPARANLVRRPRLIEQLDHALAESKLTLVSAPPGFGKTTLVSEWIRPKDEGGRMKDETIHSSSFIPHPSKVAWLSLNEGDSDPVRFFTYLIAALQQIDPTIGQSAQGMLHSLKSPPPEALLTALINDMASVSSPSILVLDDYHLISALPVHQQLAFLLEHQPPQMHLVIITREDPPLPLARLRARGQVVEIRQADLQFTAEETADFLRRVAQTELAPDDIAALQQRTEGWVAGLQLLALSLRGHDDIKQMVESFTGSHRYILDYLMDEVFQRQPADVQDFLLKTSILGRFTAPLCDALAERDNSREVILALGRANLFVVPLDQSREWYRYHHLFADLLHYRLLVESRYDVTQLHKRASQWHADNGLCADAIHHALAASDWERAADLIVSAGSDMLKRGEVVTLLGWYKSLPEDFVRAHPRLCFEYSWPLILAGQIDAAASCLARAEQSAQGDPGFLGQIAAAQAYIARVSGDGRRAVELSQKALALLPQDDWTSRSVMAMNVGMAYWYAGHLAGASQALTEAREAAHRSGNNYVEASAQVFLCKVEAARGKLHRAADAYRQVIEEGGQTPIVALAHSDLAKLLYEGNELKAAADHAQQAVELSQRTGNAEFQIAAFRTLALIKQAQGNTLAAQAALQQSSRWAQHPGISPSARWHALAYHALIALAGDEVDAASQLIEQFPVLDQVETLPDYVLLSLAQARWLLTQGQRAATAELLAARYEKVSRAGFQTAIVETRALQALAASTPEASLTFLAEALKLAQPESYIRTFADLGEPLVPILREAALRGIMPEYVGQILAAIKGKHREAVSAPSPLIEPLSEREMAVLRLVAAGLSNREIAEKLIISPGTAKSHINHICGKLGVRNRTQAVSRAKELGLV